MPRERRNRTSQFRDLARDLRRNRNFVEACVSKWLRNGPLRRLKSQRQHPIGRYIVDFYCAEARVVIELDGSTHHGRETEDAERQKWLEKQGLHVVRCPNQEIAEDEFLELIWLKCTERIAIPPDVHHR